ncbi:unpaired 1 isoform X1 [Musca autumnalis]|uniref:unpaired 1 isoform X1 n=1 Tax=Musca autumnalis TaxID=221902 RepID=UPI003CEB5BE6
MYSLKSMIVIVNLLVLIMGLTTAAPTLINNNSAKSVNAALESSASSSESSSSATNAASLIANSLRLRKRHRKRHSNWNIYNNFNENSSIVEWSNPCGGVFDPNVKNTRRPNKKEQKKIYKFLRNTAIHDLNRLNDSHRQDINISNIEIWWLHNYRYKFLPKLKSNSSIALKRWYRNMQTYVASFAYLRRIQYTYDHSKSQRESNTSQELKELLKSSRNMLCELEAAVNKTQPHKSLQMPVITRTQMNKRLKLLTKQRVDSNPHDLQAADSIDLKFVKFHYFEYLKNMWQILRKFNKRKGQTAVNNKHALTGMESTRADQINHTQFNEIEKSPSSPSSARGNSKKTRPRKGKKSKARNKQV